jgi:hypothetical protein
MHVDQCQPHEDRRGKVFRVPSGQALVALPYHTNFRYLTTNTWGDDVSLQRFNLYTRKYTNKYEKLTPSHRLHLDDDDDYLSHTIANPKGIRI